MLLVKNRRAYYDYSILEEYDAGIVLRGSEVKSIRNKTITLVDSFVYMKSGEVWLKNFIITRYKQTHKTEIHEENRDKKLLLTKKQINEIGKLLLDKGVTCVPLSVFLLNNRIKIRIGIVKGKKLWDKRNAIKEREMKKQIKNL